jgi:hypothetical protein
LIQNFQKNSRNYSLPNRIRIITAITERKQLNEELVLWSVFKHPLKELSEHQVKIQGLDSL